MLRLLPRQSAAEYQFRWTSTGETEKIGIKVKSIDVIKRRKS